VDSPDQFPIDHGFRMRGARISRVDVFSDVVLGFALVLLAVSLAIPKSFTDLYDSNPSLTTSIICFLMLVTVWFSHHVFFRRYGLHDQLTILLNAALLFLVLFCAYPLKFLYITIFTYLVRNDFSPRFAAAVQINGMLVLYALGFASAFFLVAALYWNAWRNRETLALNGIERLLTVSSIVDALGLAAIGLIACLASLVLPPSWALYSSALYLLIVPWKALNGLYFGRKARTLSKLVAAPTL
jgi:hypothetical protein